MDTQTAKQYRERWRAIAELELEEQRAVTVAERLRQLDMIYSFSRATGMSLLPDDSGPIRERWKRLKDAHERSL